MLMNELPGTTYTSPGRSQSLYLERDRVAPFEETHRSHT